MEKENKGQHRNDIRDKLKIKIGNDGRITEERRNRTQVNSFNRTLKFFVLSLYCVGLFISFKRLYTQISTTGRVIQKKLHIQKKTPTLHRQPSWKRPQHKRALSTTFSLKKKKWNFCIFTSSLFFRITLLCSGRFPVKKEQVQCIKSYSRRYKKNKTILLELVDRW